MIVVMYEYTFRSRPNKSVSCSNVEFRTLAQCAIEHDNVVAIAWSRRFINLVTLEHDIENNVYDLYGHMFSTWHTAVARLRYIDFIRWSDPKTWDWALPTAEQLARTLLSGRHQCRNRLLCYCTFQGVMYPTDVIHKKEIGHLVKTGLDRPTDPISTVEAVRAFIATAPKLDLSPAAETAHATQEDDEDF